jgi:predicted HicB family RNase H-like nuclease
MARPKLYEENRVPTAVRIPASLHQQLHDVATERDVSVNLLIVKAIGQYLEHLTPLEESVGRSA